MAEGFAKKFISDMGITDIEAASCGTFASPGLRIPEVVVRIMKEYGVDVSAHVPVPCSKDMAEEADVILTMEKHHMANMASLFPQSAGKIFLLTEFSGTLSGEPEVPDPIGRSEEVYRRCAGIIRRHVEAVIKKLKGWEQ